MKRILTTLAICALLVAGACSKQQQSATTASHDTPAAVQSQQAQMTPEQLGELGAQIKKNPDDAQRLLSQRGIDEETFAREVRKISEDPAASKRYAESYKKAGA